MVSVVLEEPPALFVEEPHAARETVATARASVLTPRRLKVKPVIEASRVVQVGVLARLGENNEWRQSHKSAMIAID